MMLESVRVQNFRSIRDATLHLGGFTALVGANGAGKSAFLKAVELFQGGRVAVEEEDYHNKCTHDDIVITLTFGSLSAAAQKAFGEYAPDGKLEVERAFAWDEDPKKRSQATYGLLPTSPDFDIIKGGKKDEAKEQYDKVREKHGLPEWTTLKQAREDALACEAKNRAALEKRRDDGRTITATGCTPMSLDAYVRFVVVPAVRDASVDAGDGKDSGTARLTYELVRDIMSSDEFIDFKAEAEQKYGDLMGRFESERLAKIAGAVAKRLDSLAGGVGVEMSWPDKTLDIGLPRTDVKLVEGGQALGVARAGHGSQRAYIISVLEEIASTTSGGPAGQGGGGQDASSLVILMEEPELYQHPVRQRHMAKVFADMTQQSAQPRAQIVYTTHSPHFVGMDRIGDIRLIRREAKGGRAGRETAVYSTSLDRVRELLPWGGKKRISNEAAAERLRVVMTPWLNEGFFADLVVLVEGDGDYAAVLGAARSRGVELEKAGIAVIPCNGKHSMDKPLAVFRSLGIETYMVWDADRGAACDPKPDIEVNRRYLKTLGEKPVDWPSRVADTHACFEKDLNKTMRDEIGGDLYDRLLKEASERLGIPARTAEKKSIVMVKILSEARKNDSPCVTLDRLVDVVWRLGGEARGAGAERRAPGRAGGGGDGA